MARRKFAPTHTLTGTPRYVPAGDSAWRSDLPGFSDEAAKTHAFWRYWRCETRFDLDDPELAPFLDLAALPEIWTLRPLNIRQMQQVNALQRRDLFEEAAAFAFARGVIGLENAAGDAGAKVAKAVAVTGSKRDHEAILDALNDYSHDVLDDVGNAIIRLSRDLSPVEKKASGSPPGGGSQSQGT